MGEIFAQRVRGVGSTPNSLFIFLFFIFIFIFLVSFNFFLSAKKLRPFDSIFTPGPPSPFSFVFPVSLLGGGYICRLVMFDFLMWGGGRMLHPGQSEGVGWFAGFRSLRALFR
jgi:hypothetical protein